MLSSTKIEVDDAERHFPRSGQLVRQLHDRKRPIENVPAPFSSFNPNNVTRVWRWLVMSVAM
jgi:hypothetical protein